MHTSVLASNGSKEWLFNDVLYFPIQSDHSDALSVPRLTVSRVTSSAVEYWLDRTDNAMIQLIAGYKMIRLGVPMIGEYVNTGRGRRVTISPAVPGAQYRITAGELGDGTRSATPAVEYATTGEAS